MLAVWATAGSSAVEVASAPPAVRLGPELALQLRQAPDLGPVGAAAGLNVGGRLATRGQVDGEQLRAPLQRRRDRPAHVRVMPGAQRDSLSNAFEGGSGNPAYRDSRCQPAWSRWGTLGAILPAFCPTALHRAAQPRITLNAQVTWILADQRERDCGEPSRTEPNESHPAENRKVGGSIPSLPTGHIEPLRIAWHQGPAWGDHHCARPRPRGMLHADAVIQGRRHGRPSERRTAAPRVRGVRQG